MKIELYFTKITQDIIRKGRITKMPPSRRWVVSWPKSCCIIGAIPSKPGAAKKKTGYLLRHEKQGAMVYDPRTAAVYKVDEEAYHTLIEMERTTDLKEVANRMGTSIRAIKTFQKRLAKLGLT